MRKALFLAALLSFTFAPLLGQDEHIVTVKLQGPSDSFRPGATRTLTLVLTIAEPYHINSSKPTEEYLVPTIVRFKPQEGVMFGAVEYPEGELKNFLFSSVPLSVYEGTVEIKAAVSLAEDYSAKDAILEGLVGYQACDNNSCLAPSEVEFSQKFSLDGSGEQAPDVPARVDENPEPRQVPAAEKKTEARSASRPQDSGVQETVAQSFERRGLLVTFLLVFLGGLALNLTPCVYPLIPVTVGYFGGQARDRRGNVVVLALVYVLGMAVTYSILGVLAAFTGSLFGAALQYPAVILVIAAILVALALSMFDLYEIRMPSFLSSAAGASRRGVFGTFLMGLTVGIIAAPCIGPFVLGLLTFVGDRGNVLLGFGLFFVLALGLGLPFLVLAVFSGSINRLPRSGAWMVWVRKIFGFVLLAMAVYFLEPLFPNELLYSLALAMVLLLGGIYMAWIEPTRTEGRAFPVLRNIVGLAFFVAALLLSSSGVRSYLDRSVTEKLVQSGAASGVVRWLPYAEEKVREAAVQRKPVFIDFYADWCLPCKELDKTTFRASEVAGLARNFLMLKADLTSSANPLARRLASKFRVKGVPTLVFLGPDGKEIQDLRVVGYIDSGAFLERMNKALSAARSAR